MNINVIIGGGVIGGDFNRPFAQSQVSASNTDFKNYNPIPDSSGVPTLTTLAFEYVKNGILTRIELAEVVLTVTAAKNINRIPMLGRDYDLIEFVSKANYEIQADCTVINTIGNDDIDYPVEKFRTLVEMLDAGTSLNVQSDWLECYGIRSVVVTGHNATQTTWANNQPVSISMISDEPFEIKIKKDAIS